MKARLFVAALLVAAAAVPAQAQGTTYSSCSSTEVPVQLVDACYTANDLFRYMAPQLGTSIAGGNATLGAGSTLGGLGHFSLGIRANVIQGRLPDLAAQFDDPVNDFNTTGTPVERNYEIKDQILGAPTVDAAIGLFGGVNLGLSKVGGIDALVSASYLPEYEGDEFHVLTPDGGLKLGFGARVGLLQESILLPGVSFTWLRRDLPTIDLLAQVEAGSDADTVAARGLSLETTAWRLVASKRFLVFGLAAGVGQDSYKTAGDLAATVTVDGTTYGSTDDVLMTLDTDVKRTNMFADLSMNLPFLKLVGEIGRVSGGEIGTFSTFDKKADDAMLYGSLGLRFQF
jgi:hypothetical protein